MKRNYQQKHRDISKHSTAIMLWGSLLILLQLGYIAFDIFSGSFQERYYAIQLYRSCFDHILLEMTLIVGGAFLFDIAEKDPARDRRP